MPIRYLPAFAAVVAAVVLPACAFADMVVVRSGERLGGKILRKSKDTLTLQTDYAGVIGVQWSKIVSIATDAPVTLQLEGSEATVSARLGEADAEQAALITVEAGAAAENPATVPLTRILRINPLPEETRKGVSYKGRINLSLAKADGNSNSERVYGETDFAARARDYRYNLNAKINRVREAGRLVSSNWLLGGNYDRFFDPRHFVYGRASVERDIFKDIRRRDMVGAGYGLQLIDTQQTQLSIRGGLDYVSILHIDNDDEQYPSLGWGVKLSHRLESYRAELFHEQEGFCNITDANQVTLRTRSGLRVPLMAGVTATSQLNIDWEHPPAAGRKATDSMLLFGLGYEW